MNKRMILKLSLFVLLVAGCAATTPFSPSSPRADSVIVYVFRPESPLSRGVMLQLNVNHENKGKLLNNAYIPVIARPGMIEFELKGAGFPYSKYASLTLEGARAGEVYYIKAKPGLLGAFDLLVLNEEAGRSEIRSALLYAQ